MYNTDEELDKELDELKEQIRIENTENEEEKNDETSDAENLVEDEESKTVCFLKKLIELSKKGMKNEDVALMMSDEFGLNLKRYEPSVDCDMLLEAEESIRKIYAEFDILDEMRKNIPFKRLVANGIELHKALLVTNRNYEKLGTEQIKCDAKREMAQMLRLGKEKITAYNASKASVPELDIAGLSDEQFAEIEERVKQNKKVYL